MGNRMVSILCFACALTAGAQEANSNTGTNREPLLVAPTTQRSAVRVEMTLRDNSTLFCTIQDIVLPFTTTYGQKLKIPLPSVQKIDFSGDKENAVISFFNQDHLTGRINAQTIQAESSVGNITIPLSTVQSITVNRQAQQLIDPRLTYWCTLDSPEAIIHPTVGPGGSYIEGIFIEGKISKALSTEGKPEALTVILPEGSLGDSGCIEFWAKLDAPRPTFGGGSNPRFFGLHTKDVGFLLEFTSNNGLGVGGLCTLFGGNTCGSSTFSCTESTSYSSILGENIDGWHHYAVAWNRDGIVSDKPNAKGQAIAVFVDGKLDSSIPASPKTAFLEKLEKERAALVIASQRYADFKSFPFSIDELKIWSYDKTDFSSPCASNSVSILSTIPTKEP